MCCGGWWNLDIVRTAYRQTIQLATTADHTYQSYQWLFDVILFGIELGVPSIQT